MSVHFCRSLFTQVSSHPPFLSGHSSIFVWRKGIRKKEKQTTRNCIQGRRVTVKIVVLDFRHQGMLHCTNTSGPVVLQIVSRETGAHVGRTPWC